MNLPAFCAVEFDTLNVLAALILEHLVVAVLRGAAVRHHGA